MTKKIIDIGFIKSGDELALTKWGVPEDVEVRFSFWDYDKETLTPILERDSSSNPQEFFKLMHDRMQEWNANGGFQLAKEMQEKDQRIKNLEEQIRNQGGTPNVLTNLN